MAGVGRIGILTGGGDCPGLNAVIRAVVARAGREHGMEVVGFLDGWRGLMENLARPLDRDAVRGILPLGGTILGTSRMDPYVHGEGLGSIRASLEAHDVDRLVVIGGDGTLNTALRLHEEGLPVIGVPKTIDNDIAATDFTFGFHTAVQVATEAIDRLTTTAEAHNRVMLVEVMGRHCGWIAAYAGLAGGAEMILVPEVPYDLDEVAETIRRRHRQGPDYSLVVVAEGIEPPPGAERRRAEDAYGFPRLGGVSYDLAPALEERTGFETRVTVLGYIQRGGSPTAYDRVLATRFGVAAADLVAEGKEGLMAALRGDDIVPVPLEEACREMRRLDPDIYRVARSFFP